MKTIRGAAGTGCLGLSWVCSLGLNTAKLLLCANKQEGLWPLRLLLANTALSVGAAAMVAFSTLEKNNTTADTREVQAASEAKI